MNGDCGINHNNLSTSQGTISLRSSYFSINYTIVGVSLSSKSFSEMVKRSACLPVELDLYVAGARCARRCSHPASRFKPGMVWFVTLSTVPVSSELVVRDVHH